MSETVFVTGNENKAALFARFVGVTLERAALELEEIQGRLEEVVEHKARQAYRIMGRPALVEDVSLEFEALEGMPGPYIKHFLGVPNGIENLCRMLDGFDSRRAIGRCIYGYYDGQQLELIEGKITGEISQHPHGENGFGWDPIFLPDGFGGKTRAELIPSDDPDLYPSVRPWVPLREFLTKVEKVTINE